MALCGGVVSASGRGRLGAVPGALGAHGSILVPVSRRHDPGCTLRAYMRLPVSQFVLIEVPLGGELRRVGADIFDVVVAPLAFFDLQLAQPECVDIQCVDFELRSSQAVQRLRLNERVRFAVTTNFSCEDGIRSTTRIQAEIDPPAPFSYLPAGVLTGVGEAAVHAALANLQRTFINSLAKDYARWATDSRYREQRRRWAVESDAALGQVDDVPALEGLTL